MDERMTNEKSEKKQKQKTQTSNKRIVGGPVEVPLDVGGDLVQAEHVVGVVDGRRGLFFELGFGLSQLSGLACQLLLVVFGRDDVPPQALEVGLDVLLLLLQLAHAHLMIVLSIHKTEREKTLGRRKEKRKVSNLRRRRDFLFFLVQRLGKVYATQIVQI